MKALDKFGIAPGFPSRKTLLVNRLQELFILEEMDRRADDYEVRMLEIHYDGR